MTGTRARLLLADGTPFEGEGFGPPGCVKGEAVFFTGMTGYEEALTDPSYAGQILVFCYPLIGNYGIDPLVRQHKTVCAAGAVCKRVSRHPSHYRNASSLLEWLADSGVPLIEGVDTRALVTRLREVGTMRAVLATGAESIAQAGSTLAQYVAEPLGTHGLVSGVSVHEPRRRGEGDVRVALLDCGVKEGIVAGLSAAGAQVVELPFDASFEDLQALGVEGLVVSNGPGDPAELAGVVGTLRRVVQYGRLPTFGICLGHQLLAEALGARTYKLKYGHRGGNQPVQDCGSGEVIITAQNHGYAVDASTLPPDVVQTMVNLNDGTNEGLGHTRLPIRSVQFHPEASPGPSDARHFFADFIADIRAERARP